MDFVNQFIEFVPYKYTIKNTQKIILGQSNKTIKVKKN